MYKYNSIIHTQIKTSHISKCHIKLQYIIVDGSKISNLHQNVIIFSCIFYIESQIYENTFLKKNIFNVFIIIHHSYYHHNHHKSKHLTLLFVDYTPPNVEWLKKCLDLWKTMNVVSFLLLYRETKYVKQFICIEYWQTVHDTALFIMSLIYCWYLLICRCMMDKIFL